MNKVQEIDAVIRQLIEELQLQPYGLDVSLESFDAKESVWMVRMKKHFIAISAAEINKKADKAGLYEGVKALFLEKFQWLSWETI